MQTMTMAQACGEAPILDTGWVPGVDFDPTDDDDMDIMRLVWDRDRHDRADRLEAENRRLRARLADLEDAEDSAHMLGFYDE